MSADFDAVDSLRVGDFKCDKDEFLVGGAVL